MRIKNPKYRFAQLAPAAGISFEKNGLLQHGEPVSVKKSEVESLNRDGVQ